MCFLVVSVSTVLSLSQVFLLLCLKYLYCDVAFLLWRPCFKRFYYGVPVSSVSTMSSLSEVFLLWCHRIKCSYYDVPVPNVFTMASSSQVLFIMVFLSQVFPRMCHCLDCFYYDFPASSVITMLIIVFFFLNFQLMIKFRHFT